MKKKEQNYLKQNFKLVIDPETQENQSKAHLILQNIPIPN
jgi:hypothetical protein